MSTHRQRHAKIVATLGPASSSIDMIRALFDAGVDVFRLNFSHGNHEDHAESLKMIHAAEAEIDNEGECEDRVRNQKREHQRRWVRHISVGDPPAEQQHVEHGPDREEQAHDPD